MKKLLTSLIFLLVLAGSLYAAIVGGLFPNTGDFPRIPVFIGSIAGALTEMLPGSSSLDLVDTGTVDNSAKLNYLTSTGYLRNRECTEGYVWKEVLESGEVVCGLPTAMLVQMGTLTGVTGSITITRGSDGSTVENAPSSTILFAGDTLSTLDASGGTIAFTDASIIRLDGFTTVKLTEGLNTDNETIAQVILSDGNLWGRVLTSSGINFEAGGYIAGVRGTSISVEKSSTGYTFAVIDSLASGDNAMGIYPKVVVGPATIESSTTKVGSGSIITVSQTKAITYSTGKLKSDLLTGSTWRVSNTVSDIEYLYTLASDPESLVPGLTLGKITELITKAESEIDVTIPQITTITTCSPTATGTSCDSDAGTKECIALGGDSEECKDTNDVEELPEDLVEEGNPTENTDNKKGRKELRIKQLLCKDKYDAKFWSTLGKCVKKDDGEEILWMADYTNSRNKYSDEELFIPQKLKDGGKLVNVSADINDQTLVLRGKNRKIRPLYEVYKGNSLLDFGLIEDSYQGHYSTRNIGINDVEYKKNIVAINSLPQIITGTQDALLTKTLPQLSTTLNKFGIKNDNTLQLYIPKFDKKQRNFDGTTTTYPGGLWLRNQYPPYPQPPLNGDGVEINTSGNYIAYPLSEMGGKDALVNKMIRIELANHVGSNLPSPIGNKWYIADFGKEKWFIVKPSSTSKCVGQIVTELTLCYSNDGKETNQGKYNNDLVINIKPAYSPTQFVIGNAYLPSPNGYGFWNPLGTIIRSITISDTP